MKDLKKNLKFILKYAYKDRIKIILLSFLLIIISSGKAGLKQNTVSKKNNIIFMPDLTS